MAGGAWGTGSSYSFYSSLLGLAAEVDGKTGVLASSCGVSVVAFAGAYVPPDDTLRLCFAAAKSALNASLISGFLLLVGVGTC